jgi:hypothetical protein
MAPFGVPFLRKYNFFKLDIKKREYLPIYNIKTRKKVTEIISLPRGKLFRRMVNDEEMAGAGKWSGNSVYKYVVDIMRIG